MRNIKGRVCAFVGITVAAFMIGAVATAAAELPTEPKCEFIASPGSSECMLPFPDDYYTKADPTSPTGRRIDFRELATPTNAASQHIEVAPYNSGDGFSPGSVITLKIPGIETTADVTAMHTVPIQHLGRYTEANAPVVVIDASTGQRWPIWVEIDSTVTAAKANLESTSPRATATSSPCAISRTRRNKICRHPQASATSETTFPRLKKRSTNGARSSKKSSRSSRRRGSRARACISHGTSRSRATGTTPAASSPCGTAHSRRSATTTSPTASSKAPRQPSPSAKSKTNRIRDRSRVA